MALAEERPLLIPCLALSAGIALADMYAPSLPLSAVAAVFFCLVISCFIRNRLPLDICVFLFFFSWGLFVLPLWTKPPSGPNAVQNYAGPEPQTVEGVIRSRPVAVSSPGGVSSRFILDVTHVIADKRAMPATGGLMIYVRSGEAPMGRGDLVRLATKISVPHKLGLPGEFDFGRYLAFQSIAAIGSVASADGIVLMRGGMRDEFLAGIDRRAGSMGEMIRAFFPDERIASVLSALLIGDQKRIPGELADAYARAGVSHILSISGFHVGIIAFFMAQSLLLVARRFEWAALRFNLRRATLLPALPAMLFYLFLTGAAPATARSVVMLGVLVAALYVERESDPVNALLLAALLLLAIDPPALFDVSFQLSFLAIWGIVVVTPPVMQLFSCVNSARLRALLRFTVSSCAASAATAIPVLFFFNQASFNGVLSNFLIVPLLGYGAVLTGFCALVLAAINVTLAHPLFWLAGRLVELSNWLTIRLADLPVLRFYGITRLDMLAFLVFACVATFVRSARLRVTLCALAPSLAVMVHLAAPGPADGKLHLTMLSVGQAESLLVRLPEGSTMLVDGGGYLFDNGLDFGERILAPALFCLGVRRIDYLVMTHCHPDHIGGLPHVAGTFPVGQFWEPVPGGSGPHYDRLRTVLAGRGTPRRLLAAGDVIDLPGGVSLRVLSPPGATLHPPGGGKSADQNEESLVLRLGYGAVSCLLAADSGFGAERRMLGDGLLTTVTVLKVGHHGSRYSTSAPFLARISPRIALISAGRGNGFGLPDPSVLARLRERGAVVYRTDLDGTIDLVSDGRSVGVSTPFRAN